MWGALGGLSDTAVTGVFAGVVAWLSSRPALLKAKAEVRTLRRSVDSTAQCVQSISKEMVNNDGGSLRDAVDQTLEALDEQKEQIRELRSDVRQNHIELADLRKSTAEEHRHFRSQIAGLWKRVNPHPTFNRRRT